MGTHPIFESDFDCLTDNEIGILARSGCDGLWPRQQKSPTAGGNGDRDATINDFRRYTKTDGGTDHETDHETDHVVDHESGLHAN